MMTVPRSISVVATVRNERSSIAAFVDSLMAQTLPPEELVIVDGASTDGTLEILSEYERAGKITLISRSCNISEGRNLGVAAARNELIAATDAGCKADPKWLQHIAAAFARPEQPDVVAANYAFETHNDFELASVLATDPPDRETSEHAKYFPSSRSIGFKKSAWAAAKGYPEWLYMGEDTLFNIRLRQLGLKFVFCHEAIVRWRPRRSWRALARQHFNYAQGNGRVGIGISGYWTNLQYHALFGLLFLAGFAWWPIWIAALAVLGQHVQRNLLRQAKYAEQATGRSKMFWLTLAVMEVVRLAGLTGFLAGRRDRLRNPSLVTAQVDWMKSDTVEDPPRLPAWSSAVMLGTIPALSLLVLFLWGWSAAAPALAFTVALVLKSIKNFSRTGPQLKQEILRHFAAYSLYSLGRLAAWAFIICLFMAGAGLLVADGIARTANLAPSQMLEALFGLLGIAAITTLQFCHQLLHLPGTIAASSNYRLSRFYPLWQKLTPFGLRAAFGVALVLVAAGALLAVVDAAKAGDIRAAVQYLACLVSYALLLVAAGWKGESRAVPAKRRDRRLMNVLMLGSDTLRADRLGIEGYARALTPVLDELVSRSTYLGSCFIPCGRTAPSLASLLTGSWPHTHGIRDNFVMATEASSNLPSVPDQLARAGYRTVAISDWAGADLRKFPFGFEGLRVPEDQWSVKFLIRQGAKDIRLFLTLFTHSRFGRRFLPELYYLAGIPMTDELGRETRDAISECAASQRPFFINAFFSTTHAPFASEYPYYTLFTDRGYAGESKFVMGLLNDPFEIIKRQRHTAKDLDLEQIHALYDGCVKRFDDEVGRILRHLKECGLAEDTLVVVYSDHGIEFFENDSWGQGNSVTTDNSSRIPVIIYDPRLPRAQRIEEISRSVDLAPTLLDLLGVEPPLASEGVSLAERIGGRAAAVDLPAFSETGVWFTRIPGLTPGHLHYPDLQFLLTVPDKGAGTMTLRPQLKELIVRAKDRAVRLGMWKLTYHPMDDGSARLALYNTSRDAGCRRNVAEEFPEVAARLLELLLAWIPAAEQLPVRAPTEASLALTEH